MLYDHRFLALQIQPLDTSVDVICPLRQCSDCSNSGLCNRVFAKYYLYHNIIQFSLPISKTFHFHLAHLCSSPTIDIDIFFGDGPLNYHIFQYKIFKQFMISGWLLIAFMQQSLDFPLVPTVVVLFLL